MLPGGGAEPEATSRVDRHGHMALTVLSVRSATARSARNKIDKLAACCKFRSFVMIWMVCHLNIEKPVLMDRHRFGFNIRMSIELLTGSWTYLDFSSKTGGGGSEPRGKDYVRYRLFSVVVGRPTLGLCRWRPLWLQSYAGLCNYKTARVLEVGHVCMVSTNYDSIDHASKSSMV